MNIDLIRTHFWLKEPGQKTYHAYSAHLIGGRSLCGKKHILSPIGTIDIPGIASGTCMRCTHHLYGFPTTMFLDGIKNEFGNHSSSLTK